MGKNILFVRTYKFAGIGGPLPPLSLLYGISALMRSFGRDYNYKIIDMGLKNLTAEGIRDELEWVRPDIVCLSSLAWEADLAHRVASVCKDFNRNITVFIEGQLPALVGGHILSDACIDYSIIGESDTTIVELLTAIEGRRDISDISGIAYRKDGRIVVAGYRTYIEDLDSVNILPEAWDLINFKGYSARPGWSGALKEKYYLPVLSSRGCPFECTFCRNREILGAKFRARSSENVFLEMMALYKKYDVREFHFFDAVFNYDIERAKQICNLIIASGVKFSLSFPHGLRPDLIDNELLELFRRAGVYKLVFGIETASCRLQKDIGKNLDLDKVRGVIKKTAQKGIIVGGYFMLGLPTETPAEIRQTINFAASSDLDLAYFFKAVPYNEVARLYEKGLDAVIDSGAVDTFGYYSKNSSWGAIPGGDLNNLIMEAQQKFYLNLRRIRRNLLKFPHKIIFLKNALKVFTLILQSYLIRQLGSGISVGARTKKSPRSLQ